MVSLLLTIFIGTIYPIFLEIFTSEQISVGPPYFNLTTSLIMGPAILVMAFAPMIKWKKDDFFGLLSRLKTIFEPFISIVESPGWTSIEDIILSPNLISTGRIKSFK